MVFPFGAGCCEAYWAAARPARAPNTRHSGSELDPRRLAPLMLDASDLAGGEQPCERCGSVDVGADAAHHVMHHRPDWNQFPDRDRHSDTSGTARERRAVGHQSASSPRWRRIEMNDRSVGQSESSGPSDPPSRRPATGDRAVLAPSSAARAWLTGGARGCSPAGSGSRPCSVSNLLRVRCLGDQNPGKRKARGMVLNELHVLQWSARAISQCHAVAGIDGRIGRVAEDASTAARA